MRGPLQFSERLYAALLVLYPQKFRSAYGQQMRLTFRDACRATARRGGAGGLLALWLPTLLDLFKTALEERARQGEISMSKSRLIAWAGPLTILVGAMWLAASLGDLAFRTGLVRDEGLLGLVSIPFFLSYVPLLFALIGTRLRFNHSASALGRFGLALSVAGSAGVFVTVLLISLFGGIALGGGQNAWVNYAPVVCLLSIRIGYILFGLDALRSKLLPRWNALPLLVGLTVVLSLPLEWFGAPSLLPSQWANPFLHFALSGACWLLLGIAMLDPKRQPQTAAAS